MTSRPRLYVRRPASKTNTSPKPDVLVLLDGDADSKLIINYLSKTPILCQVIVLSDVNALDQYYRSHEDKGQWIYLVKSDSFDEQINEFLIANDDFYSISTREYILKLEGVFYGCDEEFGIFRSEEQLVRSLRDHLNSFVPLSDVEQSSQSVSIETPRFVWFQFMFMLLSQLERSDIGMKEVNHKLRIDYRAQLETIEEFLQTYLPEKSIEWCMKDSFYFSHINHILRSKDIKNIFTYRTMIHDLEQNLLSYHQHQQQVWQFFLPMHVYRGQKTSKQELKSWQSNIGSILTMNSFLSTSMDKKIAKVFTETFDNDDNDDEATLFTIFLDKDIAPKAIFAYLYHAHCEPDDHEILFSLRTLFRIDKVQYIDSDEMWFVDMTVVDQTYEEVEQVTALWRTSILKDQNSSFHSSNESFVYVRNLSSDNGAFLSFQLSLDIILRLDRNDFAREEMFSLCRTKFHDDPFILAKINRFEIAYQYEQDAAKWYTADSFLYRLLNDVLRTEAIDSIFKLRYFIQDLHNQLSLMQIDYLKRLNNPILKLYRGQVITWNDFQNHFCANEGNLISTNHFLSTTTDRYTARIFAGDGFTENQEIYVSVLYEITVDLRLSHSVAFAELAGHTNFEDEDEILFSMGAVFRIGQIFEEHKYLWTVKLTLTTDEDEQWNILTEHLQQTEEIPNQISRQPSIADYQNEEIITPKTRRKRSRSFDHYRYSKRRSHWSEPFRTRMNRSFDHRAFQTISKEI